MRVQWKLFVILFVVGVVPLLLVASVSLRGVGQFGREVALQMESELTLMVSAQVERDAATASEAVGRGTGASRIALRALVLKTEQLLNRTITTLPKVYFSQDYDAPGSAAPRFTYPPGYTRLGTGSAKGREVSQAVSFDDLVFVTAPGVPREQVRGDIARLARLLPTCQNLFRDLGGSAYRVFVSLQSGITAAYPGFGGYPSDFDPRLSSWYRRASESGGSPVWSELLISRSTGMALFSFTMPIRAPDGSFAGVASVELPLTWFLQETELASAWTKKMHSFLVSAQEGADNGRAELHILARRSYSGRSARAGGETYEHLGSDDDLRAFQTLADDILAGGAGVSRLRFEGEDSIWAYAPLAREGMAFLLVVPVSVVSAGSQQLLSQVDDRVSVQWLVNYAAAVVLVLIAALVAYLASRRGAIVTQVMVRAWKRLAGGDFEVCLDLKTGDERDDLVAAFNETVPKLAEHLRLKRSVALAREVQQRLLPEKLPQTPGLDVAGLALYCDETGGDYYDVIHTSSKGALLVAVGDVSGHDVASALLMASVRAHLRGTAKTGRAGRTLAERVAVVNQLLSEDVSGSGRFVTLFCLEYDPGTDEIVWVRAGHEPGWLFEPGAECAVELGGKGAALGFTAKGVCEEGRKHFSQPGSLVVICTDGVFEAENEAGEPFGRERFLRAVRQAGEINAGKTNAGKASADEIVHFVLRQLEQFCGLVPLRDDVTLVAVRRIV